MKKIIILFSVAIMAAFSAHSQSVICKDGKVHFFSSTKAEDIEATNSLSICIIDASKKKVQVKVPNKSFIFKNSLMQEHFNENYMESEKFQYSSLDGVIEESVDLTKDGTYDVTIKGSLDIHGVKMDREIKGQIVVQGGKPVRATAKFKVKIEDHKIKIPTVVTAKIAEVVDVDVDFKFSK